MMVKKKWFDMSKGVLEIFDPLMRSKSLLLGEIVWSFEGYDVFFVCLNCML